MLNPIYTSVKNANLVDCGKKQHIPSQPFPLLKENYLGEFRTELDKKKVLANLGIATTLSLEWEYIKGDIGRSTALMQELDSRTKYISKLDGFQKSIIDGINYLETIVGGEEEGEEMQNTRLTALEQAASSLNTEIDALQNYLKNTIEVDINTLETSLQTISEKVNNITNLIQVSTQEGNALSLLNGEHAGLYVPDLSKQVQDSSDKIGTLRTDVTNIQESLDTFVTKEELGGGDFDFVDSDDFKSYKTQTDTKLQTIDEALAKTVKTGEDGHVDTLYVNTISKENEGSIKITDSLEVTSGIPLDIRCVVQDLEELLNLPVKTCYAGMGVIVNSLSALYILRKPDPEVTFDQSYISNIYNWKCPEDLVTVALTRSEYDNLEEINPNVFYYIFEDEVTRTQEPKRSEYSTEEEFKSAWEEWVNSLKTLSQEYMSASWGVDIENKLSKKATAESVNILSQEIAKIKGGGDGPSINSLSQSITELQTYNEKQDSVIDSILSIEDEVESGRLVDVEQSVAQVQENLKNYVTKEDLQDSDNDFIFVNKDDYQNDQQKLQESLSKQISTEHVDTSSLSVDSITLGDSTLVESEDGLSYNNQKIAVASDIPNLQVLSKEEYDKLGETLDESTYYYTYDDEESMVTKSELSAATSRLQQNIETVGQNLSKYVSLETFNLLVERVKVLEDLISQVQQPNT